jgi:hypothetical protein
MLGRSARGATLLAGSCGSGRHRRGRVELRRLLTEACRRSWDRAVLAEDTVTDRWCAYDAVLSQLLARTFTLMVW